MPEAVDIIAIHGRTPEGDGVSRPFRCEGEDGRDYFVKLKNAGYECLVKEWIAGRLAHEMGLPAAEIRQVRIPRDLVAGHAEYERELGHGLAFGSRGVADAERLALEFVRDDPEGLLSRILLFDRWVRNSDRILSEIGGNPNLLWELDPPGVVMIDHDNAFDPEFAPEHFWEYHALRQHHGAWEASRRPEMTAWLAAGAARLDDLWAELPAEWLEDSYGERRCGLDRTGLAAVLSSFQTSADFWRLPDLSS